MDILKLDVSRSEVMSGYLATKEPGDVCKFMIEARYRLVDSGEAEFDVEKVTVKGRGGSAVGKEMGGVEYIFGTGDK